VTVVGAEQAGGVGTFSQFNLAHVLSGSPS